MAAPRLGLQVGRPRFRLPLAQLAQRHLDAGLEARRRVEPGHQHRDVSLYGALADPEVPGDGLIGEPGQEQCDQPLLVDRGASAFRDGGAGPCNGRARFHRPSNSAASAPGGRGCQDQNSFQAGPSVHASHSWAIWPSRMWQTNA